MGRLVRAREAHTCSYDGRTKGTRGDGDEHCPHPFRREPAPQAAGSRTPAVASDTRYRDASLWEALGQLGFHPPLPKDGPGAVAPALGIQPSPQVLHQWFPASC